MNKYAQYEAEKKRLYLTCKDHAEYERKLKQVIKRLKI